MSKNGNIFVFFENPKMTECPFIGAFVNEYLHVTGPVSIVNPYQAKLFAMTWVKDAEKKEIEVEENFENSLWEKVSLGAYVNSSETSDEYFKVFMVQQPNKLEIFTYQIGTKWFGYEGAVGYQPQEPSLVSKLVNGEPTKRSSRRRVPN